MKSNILKLSSALALLGATFLGNLSATPVLITTLDISAFPSYGDDNVQTEIGKAITAWNLANNPDLPTTGIGATPDFKADNSVFGTNLLSINLTLGDYNYIFLHWGGPDADASYKNPQLYYIGGESGPTVFTAPFNFIEASRNKPAEEKQYGLSFYSFYSPRNPPEVPDSGATAIFLGLGLVALGLFRRKL